MNTLAQPPRPQQHPKRHAHQPRRAPVGPLLWWALVMVLALFSFYIYVLQEQVLRGEQFRQAQQAPRDSSSATLRAAAGPLPSDPGGEAFDLLRMPPAWALRVGATR